MNENTDQIIKNINTIMELAQQIENYAFHIGNKDIRTKAIRIQRMLKMVSSDITK
jgi:hypothetical protein